MKHFLLLVLFSVFTINTALANSPGNTGAIFSLSVTPGLSQDSDFSLEGSSDYMMTFTFAGVNVLPDNNYFMRSGLFFNFGFSQYAYQKRDFDFKEHKMFNVGLTFPLAERVYSRVGGGLYWKNSNVDNKSVEEERLLNAHFGAGYFLTERIAAGATYDTGLGNFGLEIGFQF